MRIAVPPLLFALAACGRGEETALANTDAIESNAAESAPLDANRTVPSQSDSAELARVLAGGEPGVCAFDGWSLDRDPEGLDVRAEPNSTATIVGRLPPPRADADREWATGFTVVAARDGWFQIQNVIAPGYGERSFEGQPMGWIHGSLVGFGLQTERAFAMPDLASPVVAETWFEGGAERRFTWRQPSDCKGEWVRLLVTGRDGVERVAWASGVCGVQETTCDGGTWGVSRNGAW